MNTAIKSIIKQPSLGLINSIVANDSLREWVFKLGDKAIYKAIVEKNPYGRPVKVQEDKYYLLRNLLNSINKALKNKNISPEVQHSAINTFLGKVFLAENPTTKLFEQKYGFEPPSFLLISPTKRCNLNCIGCYASSSSKNAEHLDFETVNRIMNEKRELWGSHFTVISGGEPTLWRDNGKDIIDLAAKHDDNYFLMFTNGTTINDKTAKRLAEVGNITPAISVEGLEKETDARRGKGVHKKILKSFEILRNYGVPFGISVTAMKNNVNLITSDEFIDFYFEEQGAIYGWIFQYMPIGRSYTLDLMVTPEQRLELYKKEQYMVKNRKIFIADFWNSGPASNGCIAAGRSGGYFYIDWNGNCSPCAFYPYKTHNIKEVYKNGGDLNTVLLSPFFTSIRKWQDDYSYRKPTFEMGNQIVPCAIKDHYENAKKTIIETGAQPIDQPAALALTDEEYAKGLIKYGEEVDKLTQPIWEQEYIGPEKAKLRIPKAS